MYVGCSVGLRPVAEQYLIDALTEQGIEHSVLYGLPEHEEPRIEDRRTHWNWIGRIGLMSFLQEWEQKEA